MSTHPRAARPGTRSAVDQTPPTAYDERAAPVMFLASLAFLVFLAGAIQAVRGSVVLPTGTRAYAWGMLALYPLFLGELAWLLARRDARWRSRVWYCLAPPLRLGARDLASGSRIWLPVWRWVTCDRQSRRHLEAMFAGPMIVIALLILPVLATEHFLEEQVQQNVWLAFFVDTGTSVIWLAFAFEFIVMVSVADKKFDYCRRHWLDLLIVLLPLVAFLRLARLGQLVRLQQLGRMTRLYRLRGLSMRLFRALLAVNLVRRLLQGHPQRRYARLRELISEKEHELAELRDELAELERRLAVSPAED